MIIILCLQRLKAVSSDTFISNTTSFFLLDFLGSHWLTFPSFCTLTSQVIISSICQVTIFWRLGHMCNLIPGHRSLWHIQVALSSRALWRACLRMNSLAGSGSFLEDRVPNHQTRITLAPSVRALLRVLCTIYCDLFPRMFLHVVF